MFILVAYVIILITGFFPAKGQILSFCPDPIEGEECSITCTTPDHHEDIFFLKTSDPSTNIASCISGTCFVVNSYTISQPNGTTTVLRFNHTRGNAEEWLCRYGSSSTTKIMKWGTYPTTITATGFPTNTNITSEQEADVKLTCLYSENPPVVTVIHTDSGSTSITFSTPVTCTITNETCTDSDFDTYTCKVIISPSNDLLCTETFSLGVSVKISNIQTPSMSLALGTDISYECQVESANTIDCNVSKIVGTAFGGVIAFLVTTLIIILLFWKHILILKIISAVMIIDIIYIIIYLWSGLFAADYEEFRSYKDCHVHGSYLSVISVSIALGKGVGCRLLKEKGKSGNKTVLTQQQNQILSEVEGKVCPSNEKKKETTATKSKDKKKQEKDVEKQSMHGNQLFSNDSGQVSTSNEKKVDTGATTEDIILLMYFAIPKGYTINKWITEGKPSIENNLRHVSHKRGTIVVKSATENDNGIYQGILQSDSDEQRVNAVLHVTGNNSVNLVVHALLWRLVKNKHLKNINDLKDIRHKIIKNDIENIPKKKKKEGESKVSIKSVMWTHDGLLKPNLCDHKEENGDVSPLTVTMKKKPIEEYYCTVEFTNKKSHEYIFIVKFTGVLSDTHKSQLTSLINNEVHTIDDVIGVPTILSTKREEKHVTLAPLRETKPTAELYEKSLQQVTGRSAPGTR